MNKNLFLDLNKKNSKCFAVVGTKAFTMANFVKAEGKTIILEKDGVQYEVKKSWIKNIADVEREIANDSIELTGIAATLKAKGYEFDWKEVMRLEKLMSKKADDSIEGLMVTEAKRNNEMSWMHLCDLAK